MSTECLDIMQDLNLKHKTEFTGLKDSRKVQTETFQQKKNVPTLALFFYFLLHFISYLKM